MNKHTSLTIIGGLIGFSVFLVVREVQRQEQVARFVNDYNGIVNKANNILHNENYYEREWEREQKKREWEREKEHKERVAQEERELAQWKETAEARNLEIGWTSNANSFPLSNGVSIEMRSVSDILWFGKTEVTQAQWEAVMGDNPSEFKNPDNPVENVSWDDCRKFLKKLNKLSAVKNSGLTFRLPTEEEWEFACRAGATGDYCLLADGTEITGDTLGQVAWFSHNSDAKPHLVGEKKPNAFGLYDMHGNVSEWTSTAVGKDRVARSGRWSYSARGCESSYRDWFPPSYRYDFLGFRLCASGRAD